jgi:hypothetical protein
MIYGLGGKKAYAVCDPRKKLEEVGPDGQPLDVVADIVGLAAEAPTLSGNHSLRAAVPPYMRRVQSHRGKQRIKEFDYASLNVSNCSFRLLLIYQ